MYGGNPTQVVSYRIHVFELVIGSSNRRALTLEASSTIPAMQPCIPNVVAYHMPQLCLNMILVRAQVSSFYRQYPEGPDTKLLRTSALKAIIIMVFKP